MRVPRPKFANVTALLALVVAVGGGAVAIGQDDEIIYACVRNDDETLPGRPRIVAADTVCVAAEHKIQWNQEGPPGSPDTPQQILNKLSQVDGDGSGLDASFLDGINSTQFLRTTGQAADSEKLDGINSTQFLRTTGKAADADKLDNLNSSAFAKRASSGTGAIYLGSLSANSCANMEVAIGGLKVGDVLVMNTNGADKLPARVTLTVMGVPADGKANLRWCNGTNGASATDSDIRVRYFAFRP